jgi:3-oxoacyl-(acyl-carrier-protein) synthase
MTGRVAITGAGIVSAIGADAREVWSSIEAERSGLRALTLFESARYGSVPIAEVTTDVERDSGLSSGSRSDHLAVVAARQAFAEARLGDAAVGCREGAGVVLGATVGGMLKSAVFLERLVAAGVVDAELLRHHECASSTDAIAASLGLFGPCATISTACSSGGNAIGLACDLICSGETDVVLAGGTDSLCRFTLNGFGSLLLVDPEGCRPFDRARGGMSLGEGAGIFCLESEAHAARRGVPVKAWVSGWSSTCDAHHTASPQPEGHGVERAMRDALGRAGLEASNIQYVNAHGTGTKDNDIAEGVAYGSVFGDRMPAVSSTKRFFGHTFGAAGAIEAMVCMWAIENSIAPINLGLTEPDPACGITPVTETRSREIDHALSVSLGFGGNNACLVISRAGAT